MSAVPTIGPPVIEGGRQVHYLTAPSGNVLYPPMTLRDCREVVARWADPASVPAPKPVDSQQISFSYRWRVGANWREVWHVDGRVVTIEYCADWWAREGSLADLRRMARVAAEDAARCA